MRERKLLMTELMDFMNPEDEDGVESTGPRLGASLQDLED